MNESNKLTLETELNSFVRSQLPDHIYHNVPYLRIQSMLTLGEEVEHRGGETLATPVVKYFDVTIGPEKDPSSNFTIKSTVQSPGEHEGGEWMEQFIHIQLKEYKEILIHAARIAIYPPLASTYVHHPRCTAIMTMSIALLTGVTLADNLSGLAEAFAALPPRVLDSITGSVVNKTGKGYQVVIMTDNTGDFRFDVDRPEVFIHYIQKLSKDVDYYFNHQLYESGNVPWSETDHFANFVYEMLDHYHVDGYQQSLDSSNYRPALTVVTK